jgi:hypothetical protein
MLQAGMRHAGGLYRSCFRWAGRSARHVEAEARHLQEIERAGEAGETPYIAILGVFLFLLPIFLFISGAAFIAYYVVA